MRLDESVATRFGALALANIAREYPHKLDHVIEHASDLGTPRAFHPAFHGSFDWHSCVHMHWLLARLRNRFPAIPQRAAIDALFDRHFAADAIDGELAYLGRPSSASFERTYGWAWLLKLAAELHSDQRLRPAIEPLARAFVARYLEVLRRTHYPVRHGTHANTAFALAFALDYAAIAGDATLANACSAKAREWFFDDRDAPARFEPSGTDFLSPSLLEAALMQRVLDGETFARWIDAFLPGFANATPATLFEPAKVTDRNDPQIVHLDGLNLSRAWCFASVANAWPVEDRRASQARNAARIHLTAGLVGLESDAFVGAHWLATFAVLALDG
ncbi:MAG TPA: DUF2891 domain-containing protein [Casimicrobiaceae bacterium]|nr:DUF2891 domain-containing protein [Casimicrobiaceae bacterium]